jgi:hypothetical protein
VIVSVCADALELANKRSEVRYKASRTSSC